MPEADVNANAAAIAGSASAPASPAPSLPASTGADGGARDASGAYLADDDILALADKGAAAPPSAAIPADGAQPPAPPEPGAQPAPPAGAADFKLEDFSTLFPTNPKVQSLFDRWKNNEAVVSQFGTMADAREAAGAIEMLGGLKELNSLVERVSGVEETDAVMWGGDMPAREGFANRLYDGAGPHEFGLTSQSIYDQLKATLSVMHERDVKRWEELRGDMTAEVLGDHQFDRRVNAIAQEYEKLGVEPPASVKELLGWATHYGLTKPRGGQPSPEEQKLAAERAQLATERTSWNEERVNGTMQEVNTQLRAIYTEKVATLLKDLQINGRKVFGENSKLIQGRLAKEAMEHAFGTMLGGKTPFSQGLLNQIAMLNARGGLAGKAKELVELNQRFLDKQLPLSIEAVSKEWTDAVIAQTQGATARAQAAAARPDVGGGAAPGGRGARVPKVGEVDYKKTTDDQILGI